MKELSTGAVIYRKEGKTTKYLLLLYGAGHWDYAKGHVEKGESEEETTRREVAEETGITDLRIVPGFRENISYFFKGSGKTIAKNVIFFLAETKTAKIRISFEHKDFAWLPYEEALQRITYDNSKNVLRKAHEFLMSRKGLS